MNNAAMGLCLKVAKALTNSLTWVRFLLPLQKKVSRSSFATEPQHLRTITDPPLAGTMDQSNKTHRKPKEKKKFTGKLSSSFVDALY